MNKETAAKAFDKHAALIVREEEPFNAGPPLDLLRQNLVTPQNLFFVRNHGSVPDIDPARFRLSIAGMVKKPLSLSLDEIRHNFPRQTVVATLQCAGNRREDFMLVKHVAGEVPWGAEAVSTARWSGASLRDVLSIAGVEAEAQHVCFNGMDEIEKQNKRFGFGGSIPIEKALSSEVLLAYEMNDNPLTPVHGAPLRAVVPGYIGARSVKWLAELKLQDKPSENYYQAHAYKLFPPGVEAETADWENGLMLGESSLNSVITYPFDGETLPNGDLVVQGYATAGGERTVERVDVSVDQGETWVEAKLQDAVGKWAWRFWEAELKLEPGTHVLTARAWDSAANTQPEDARKIWNFKGYMNNAWHRVRVSVQG